MIYRLKKEDTYRELAIQADDTVLFQRGSVIHDLLDTVPGVHYGAWGEGDAPVISGTDDVSEPSSWKEVGENVWKCVKNIRADVGDLIFNGTECKATLRWEKKALSGEGDFFDESFGRGFGERGEDALYLFSEGNPGKKYEKIETVPFGNRKLAEIRDGVTFEDLTFFGGLHGAQGAGDNVTIRRCHFKAIGGNVWSKERRIRFGNGIEFWDRGDHITVEDCDFRDIYDSCVTYQGSKNCLPTHGFICRRNHFDTYGMAAFEYRDKMPVDSTFEDNICENAGCGFALLGETPPRNSEIWPQPMGHHLFFWRMPCATPGGGLLVKNNLFGPAPNGAAVYAIIAKEAEEQIIYENNRYTGKTLL